MNAKRPLPVTPCFVEPADDAVDTDQESVSTTPSSTEFVFLMEQLQMSPSQDKDQDVPGIFDLTHTMNLTLNIASSSNYSVAGLKEPLCTILVLFFFLLFDVLNSNVITLCHLFWEFLFLTSCELEFFSSAYCEPRNTGKHKKRFTSALLSCLGVHDLAFGKVFSSAALVCTVTRR